MDSDAWEGFPTYIELLRAIFNFLAKQLQQTRNRSQVEWTSYLNFTVTDVLLVILASVTWTFLRYFLTETFLKALGRNYMLTSSNQQKMPESAWKFFCYFIAWSFNCYILILSGDHKFFQKPSTMWEGWSLQNTLPSKMYFFYVAQCGFYFHSLYATVFMDTWRKDSILMIVHHTSTLILIVLSFVLRCHNIGCLVLFLHDVCDVFLESSKLNVYFKIQDNKIVKFHEILANISFLCFTVTWYIARMYWYPLRVLYTGISDINGLQSVLPCSLLMNSLLWTLQILNIYWFYLILQTLYRVATGQLLDDVREYDVQEKLNEILRKENANNSVDFAKATHLTKGD